MNSRHMDYDSTALTPELHRRNLNGHEDRFVTPMIPRRVGLCFYTSQDIGLQYLYGGSQTGNKDYDSSALTG